MELNKNYMPAILLLVELLLDEENAEEAIKLMKRVILVQPTSNLMSMLADIYMSTNEPMHAVEYYTKALKYASSFSDSRYRASFIVYIVFSDFFPAWIHRTRRPPRACCHWNRRPITRCPPSRNLWPYPMVSNMKCCRVWMHKCKAISWWQ